MDSFDSSDESGSCDVRCFGGVRIRLGATVGLVPWFFDGTTAGAAITGACAIVGGCTVVPNEIEPLFGLSKFVVVGGSTWFSSFPNNVGRPLSK